jgi:hypothetical protein
MPPGTGMICYADDLDSGWGTLVERAREPHGGRRGMRGTRHPETRFGNIAGQIQGHGILGPPPQRSPSSWTVRDHKRGKGLGETPDEIPDVTSRDPRVPWREVGIDKFLRIETVETAIRNRVYGIQSERQLKPLGVMFCEDSSNYVIELCFCCDDLNCK